MPNSGKWGKNNIFLRTVDNKSIFHEVNIFIIYVTIVIHFMSGAV